jgi:4-diphosphocytidyl-2-C-methyl-D-erythritol kinase
MICFPNAKINLGLHIIEKRNDGFHNIETVFYPIGWKDILEIVENKNWEAESNKCELFEFGKKIEGDISQNILIKAYQLLNSKVNLPPLKVYLFKNIPMGAGLGGGSADAAFFIKLMNEKFELKFNEEQLVEIASELGSDCAFFIKNKPVYAFEKGNKFKKCEIDLSGYSIITIFPNIHSNTKLAYSRVTPKIPSVSLEEILSNTKPENWTSLLQNDFESSVFYHFPEIKNLKDKLYNLGAIYASLSGSGSAVYGIFKKNNLPDLNLIKPFLYQIS